MFGSLQRKKGERLKAAFIKVRKRSKNSLEERKMNQDVNANRKLFWKEMSKANGGKVENSTE